MLVEIHIPHSYFESVYHNKWDSVTLFAIHCVDNLNYYQDVKKYYIFTYFLGDSEGSGSGWNGILFDDEESDMSQSLGRFKL